MYLFMEGPSTMASPKKVKTLKGGEKIRMECVLQSVGDVNRNGRTYDKTTMQESINEIKPRIESREFLGELDHPINENASRQTQVALQEVSHVICEVGWEGNLLIGVVETLRTDNGFKLKNLAEDSIPVGFSYRGMGDLKQIRESGRTIYKVTGPLMTITWDAVAYPSHKQAKVRKIYTESCGCLMESGGINKVEIHNALLIDRQMIKTVYESIDPSNIIERSDGMICTKDGYCFLPNDYDRLLEQRKQRLLNKFKF